MDKALYDEVIKMNEEMTNQGKASAATQKPEQKEEETQTNYNGQEITVPIMTGEVRYQSGREGKNQIQFHKSE